MDCRADADSWSSAEPYLDAVEDHQPPADEVVELSGDDDSGFSLSAPHAAMQHPSTPASREAAPDLANAVLSRGQGDEHASIRPLSHAVGAEGVASPAKDITVFAAVIEMVRSQLRLLQLRHMCSFVDWRKQAWI